MRAGVKVFAPATVANVSVGFDILGFAIDHLGDIIYAKQGKKKGVHITQISGDGKKLPREAAKNTAGYAAMKFLESIGQADFPMEMEIHKKMPLCSGLGSSAASAVAGVMAANDLLGLKKSKDELLRFAVMGEELVDSAWHADNIAPSLYGGITLIRDNATLDVVHLPVPRGLYALIIHPHHQLQTKESRGVLSDQISLKNHILQSGNMAALVASLYNSDFELLRRSLQDLIIEPQRAHLIPEFYATREIAEKHNAIGHGISGAGPSMFCLCHSTMQAEAILEDVKKHFADQKMNFDLYVSKINQQGAYKF